MGIVVPEAAKEIAKAEKSVLVREFSDKNSLKFQVLSLGSANGTQSAVTCGSNDQCPNWTQSCCGNSESNFLPFPILVVFTFVCK